MRMPSDPMALPHADVSTFSISLPLVYEVDPGRYIQDVPTPGWGSSAVR